MAEGDQVEFSSKEKKGFFERMGLFQKVMIAGLFIIFILIIVYFVFGGLASVYDFFFLLIIIVGLFIVGYVVLKAVGILLRPKYFSPKENYFTAIVNLAMDLKPDNVQNLYFEGDKDKRRVKAGRIVGILGIPYLIGTPKIDSNGAPVMIKSKLLDRKIPVFEKIEYSKDGDTLFVYESGFIFPRKHYLRCNRKLHGDIHGDVAIYDINPVPYGSWEYPFKQYQKDPSQIMIQTQMEIILATHEHQGDYISQVADSSISWSPYIRAVQQGATEFSGEGGNTP